MIPGDAAVTRNPKSTIVADDEVVVVRGIDPQRELIAVEVRGHRAERLALVVRDVQPRAEAIDAIDVLRVSADLDEEPGGLVDARVHMLPALAAVAAAIHAALSGLEAATRGLRA